MKKVIGIAVLCLLYIFAYWVAPAWQNKWNLRASVIYSLIMHACSAGTIFIAGLVFWLFN